MRAHKKIRRASHPSGSTVHTLWSRFIWYLDLVSYYLYFAVSMFFGACALGTVLRGLWAWLR
jgi:hypothetical protein